MKNLNTKLSNENTMSIHAVSEGKLAGGAFSLVGFFFFFFYVIVSGIQFSHGCLWEYSMSYHKGSSKGVPRTSNTLLGF